jgi:hypothetical protein
LQRSLVRLALLLVIGGVVAQPTGAVAQADLRPLSAEDCAVWAAMGRAYLHWGKDAPPSQQFQIFYRPSGKGYVEQCPWAAMGITPSPADRYDPDNTSFFTGPDYSNGGQTAVVHYGTKLTAKGADSKPGPPFMEGWSCTLTKTAGRWTLKGCDQDFIT